ncbi:MAG TPA: hypothetical protein VKV95_17785 [Terriglobia bacterium]|nr:hypothetical protein [Terriglobia bacterium]
MLEKEWITNDKGQIEAIWFERDRISPAKIEFAAETAANSTEPRDIIADHLRDIRISAAFRRLQSLRATAKQSAPIGSTKSGHWNRFYTILRSVLP